ncbi:MAG: hypothetical protein GXP63_04255 [DPANN group archaeon]|nr:hypothetical protein [DPANN group archaeon]
MVNTHTLRRQLLLWIRSAKKNNFSDAAERNEEFNRIWTKVFDISAKNIPTKIDEAWGYDQVRNALVNAWAAWKEGDADTMKKDVEEARRRFNRLPE